MKKLTTIILTTLLALTGCTMNKTIVKPISNSSDYYNAFNEEAHNIFKEAFESDDPTLSMKPFYLNVGTELPDAELSTYDGSTINPIDYKGKKVVMEFISYWCQFCQTESREYLDEIIENNDDVVFIQCFLEGGKNIHYMHKDGSETIEDTIKQFYEKAEAKMRDDIIIVQQTENLENVADTLGVNSYPTFMFFDESGRMSWCVDGLVKTDMFNKYCEIAFDNEVKLYDNFREGLTDPKTIYRTYEDVKDDITDEANQRLESLSLDSEKGEEAFYSNVGVSISFENEMTDYNGEVMDLSSDNKNIIFSYLWDSDELDEQVKVINELQKDMQDEDVVFVTFILQSKEDRDINTIVSELKEPVEGYIIKNLSSNLNRNWLHIKLTSYPQIFFMSSKEDICMGSYLGDFTVKDIAEAYNVMCVDNPIYECVKN